MISPITTGCPIRFTAMPVSLDATIIIISCSRNTVKDTLNILRNIVIVPEIIQYACVGEIIY